MDRPVSTPAGLLPGVDDLPPSGWDARTVWQQRVRDPHHRARGKGGTPRIVLEQPSTGWDPLETWRLRVHRPRKPSA